MTGRDDDLRIRPGRMRDGGRTSKQPTRFVNEVMRAARKSGHTGYRIGAGSTRSGNTSFGRGRFARTANGLTRTSRRVVVKARVVRHQGKRFRSAPMTQSLERLERDQEITPEALALFVRFWLTTTPPLPDDTYAAAKAKGKERYGGFVKTLSRRLAKGSTLTKELVQDLPVGQTNQTDGINE